MVWPIVGGIALGLAAFAVFGIGSIYVIIPLIVRFTAWQSAAPVFAPREPMPGSGEVDALFDAVGPTLADAGYRDAQRWTIRGLHTKTYIEIMLMSHRERKTVAAVYAIFAMVGARWKLNARAIEFTSRRADGFVFSTTNTPMLPPVTEWPHKRATVLERVQEPLELEAAHLALRADVESGAWDYPPSAADLPPTILKSMVRDLEAFERRGWMKRDAARARFNLTFRGAYALTWRMLWPVSWFRRRRLARRAEALLASHGLPVPAPR